MRGEREFVARCASHTIRAADPRVSGRVLLPQTLIVSRTADASLTNPAAARTGPRYQSSKSGDGLRKVVHDWRKPPPRSCHGSEQRTPRWPGRAHKPSRGGAAEPPLRVNASGKRQAAHHLPPPGSAHFAADLYLKRRCLPGPRRGPGIRDGPDLDDGRITGLRVREGGTPRSRRRGCRRCGRSRSDRGGRRRGASRGAPCPRVRSRR
jgi:hypothetical protein